MAEELRLPTGFFFKDAATVSDTLFYRSMVANTKVARLRAERKYVWLKQLFSYVKGFIRIPNVNLPLLR